MAHIVVCGGGVIGLSTAMLLARDGHDVTVLEADEQPPPPTADAAWTSWRRKGVAQFHQPHNLFPRFRAIADDALPGLTDGLLAAGCTWVDPLHPMPRSLDSQDDQPGDDRFAFVTGRRPVVESVVARTAEETPRVTVRRGVRVTELVAGVPAHEDIPHVSGVRLGSGEVLPADLVVDAMGRRSVAGAWLTAVGARPPYEESEDCGFAYYTRYYVGDVEPERRAPGLTPMGSMSILTLTSDNATWSVTLYTAAGDAPLKGLRDADAFSRVLAACPRHAHWIDGEPITDVLAMAGIVDRYRRFAVDGRPVVTGFAAVGDAWACTNPSAGRGLSVGLMQAHLLSTVVRKELDDPYELALAWDTATEETVAPYYRAQISADRSRFAEMTAAREGSPMPPPDPMVSAFLAASGYDAVVFRALVETATCLALPSEVMARPGMVDRVAAYVDHDRPAVPGPDRAALLALVGGTAA